jgi:nucleoside-diphosphate-sugar epimerase
MKILVTGANGFIGGALLAEARARDLAVRAVCRSQRAAQGLKGAAEDVVVVPSLTGETDWTSAFDSSIDVVVHCAARAHVLSEDASDPLTAFRQVNVEGTLNLARQAEASGVRRFVFISSIGVNGAATHGRPFAVTDMPAPEEPYAVSKLEAERGLEALAERTVMEVVIIRPPLVYGLGAPGSFGRLITAIKKGAPLPLGSVRNHRTLISLGNLVDLILLCTQHPAAANQVFLAGDAVDLSTTDLLRHLGMALGKPARLLPVPVFLLDWAAALLGRREMVRRICGDLQVDISKTSELLGWAPPLSVDEGLRLTMKNAAKRI